MVRLLAFFAFFVAGHALAQLTPTQAETQPPPVINLVDHHDRRRSILDGLTSEYQIAA